MLNVYSIKGYIYSNDTRKISDQINKYATIRSSVIINGSKVEFEVVTETKINRDDLMTKINIVVDTYGGRIIFSECGRKEDGSVGTCVMTGSYSK